MTQKFENTSQQSIDDNATLADFGEHQRIIYQEEDSIVTLDIQSESLGLKRNGTWTTIGYFSKESSTLEIHSQEGTITFTPVVKELIIQDQSIDLKYDLMQNGEYIDSYEYQCTWRRKP